MAVVMLATLALMPVAASEPCGCGEAPLVCVTGFSAATLYQNYGTDQEQAIFPPSQESIEGLASDIGVSLIQGFINYGINNKDSSILAAAILKPVAERFEPIAYNADGTPKYDDLSYTCFSESLDSYEREVREAYASAYALKTGKQIGWDHVYIFMYDWRESPVDIAADLDAFIENVKDETGHDKVNLAAESMGAAVTAAYLSIYENYDSIKNIVFISPAFQGTSIAGDVFTGKINIDVYGVYEYLQELSNDSEQVGWMTALLLAFLRYQGLLEEFVPDINRFVNDNKETIRTELTLPIFAGMPGLWSMIPASQYEAAKSYLYPEGVDPELEAKIDEYYNIQINLETVLNDAMDAGVNVAIISNYHTHFIPVIESDFTMSDGVIDTVYSSAGATCARHGHVLREHYQQANTDCGHYHLSTDGIVDASTCLFPEQTWLIKNLGHVEYAEDEDPVKLVMWLLGMDEQYTVWTDTQNFPQFLYYVTWSGEMVPLALTEAALGDIDNDGVASSTDARLALRIATGLETTDARGNFLGDVDFDGNITAADARRILRVATKLESFEEIPGESETPEA